MAKEYLNKEANTDNAPAKDNPLLNARFPYPSVLSLKPLIRYWEGQLQNDNAGMAAVAGIITERLKEAPALQEPIRDEATLEQHKDLIELMMSVIVPPALASSKLHSANMPFRSYSFYHTPAFARSFLHHEHYMQYPVNMEMSELRDQTIISACMLILDRCYKIQKPVDEQMIYALPDQKTRLERYYRLTYIHDFVDVIPQKELKPISQEELQLLFRHIQDPEKWFEYFPQEDFRFEGFSVLSLVEVTDEEALSSLKDMLLQKDALLSPEMFDQIQEKLQMLFGLPDLRLGISSVRKSRNMFINFGSKFCPSFILHNTLGIDCTGSFEPLYDKLESADKPLVIEDLEQEVLPGGFKNIILSLGIRNLVLAIMKYGDEIQGVLELGSPNVGDLTTLSLDKVNKLLPLFAVAVRRNADDLENKVQTIIKEKFTAIHPTIEWKFTDAALNLLDKIERKLPAEIDPIVFENVYPLFAAIDIRNSSVERNRAIQEDLVGHLTLVKEVLKEAMNYQSLPILSELKFSVNRNLKRIKSELLSQDEADILDTIRREVEPLFRHLVEQQPELRPVIRKYFNSMDPTTGFMYRRRKDFEDSLTMINETISAYLDREDEKAQKMYPHYFEKYKSDGVEFKIYVGQSLVEHIPFDLVFLKNLRLWQFMAVCEITRMTESLKARLRMPLETTQLILVHNQPFSISFRTDERHFDVNGAYNIRYEIIKKRIDKALVSGSNERVTQPGKIAIILSQEKEEAEYLEFIEYLQAKGYLGSEIEYLNIQEMQGVSGLRALRVSVLPDKTTTPHIATD